MKNVYYIDNYQHLKILSLIERRQYKERLIKQRKRKENNKRILKQTSINDIS